MRNNKKEEDLKVYDLLFINLLYKSQIFTCDHKKAKVLVEVINLIGIFISNYKFIYENISDIESKI